MFKGWSRKQRIAYGVLCAILFYIVFLWYNVTNAAQSEQYVTNVRAKWVNHYQVQLDFNIFNEDITKACIEMYNPSYFYTVVWIDVCVYPDREQYSYVYGYQGHESQDYKTANRPGNAYRTVQFPKEGEPIYSNWAYLENERPPLYRLALPLVIIEE